jgi:hypothetical protein
MRSALVLAVTCALAATVLAEPTSAPLSPAQQKRADELFEQGRDLMNKKDPAGACKKFDEAILLDPLAAGTMLNLGLCNEQLGKYKTALYWFRKAQRRATETNPPLPDHERAAKQHTADLVNKVATVKLAFPSGEPDGMRVKVDGEEIPRVDFDQVEVDPGHHVLSAGAPGKKIVRQDFDVQGHGGETLPLAFVDGDNTIIIDRGKPRRRNGMIVGIAGAGALVTAGIVIGVETREYNNAKDGARMGNASDLDTTKHAASVVRWVGTPLVVGGIAAIAVGSYLYFGAPAQERIDQTVFAPTIGRDHLGFAISGSF